MQQRGSTRVFARAVYKAVIGLHRALYRIYTRSLDNVYKGLSGFLSGLQGRRSYFIHLHSSCKSYGFAALGVEASLCFILLGFRRANANAKP